jgi:hypothetical protein
MNKKYIASAIAGVGLLTLTGCAGIRGSDGTLRAWSLIPQGMKLDEKAKTVEIYPPPSTVLVPGYWDDYYYHHHRHHHPTRSDHNFRHHYNW